METHHKHAAVTITLASAGTLGLTAAAIFGGSIVMMVACGCLAGVCLTAVVAAFKTLTIIRGIREQGLAHAPFTEIFREVLPWLLAQATANAGGYCAGITIGLIALAAMGSISVLTIIAAAAITLICAKLIASALIYYVFPIILPGFRLDRDFSTAFMLCTHEPSLRHFK